MRLSELTLTLARGGIEDADTEARVLAASVSGRPYASFFGSDPELDGGALYRALKQRGILVRHFDSDKISQYNRITVGTREQADALLGAIKEIMEEVK